MVSETKIDGSFPIGNFLIHGFSKGGGIMLYIREPIENYYVELNLRNEKYLINCSYNPHLAT